MRYVLHSISEAQMMKGEHEPGREVDSSRGNGAGVADSWFAPSSIADGIVDCLSVVSHYNRVWVSDFTLRALEGFLHPSPTAPKSLTFRKIS